MKPNKNTLKTKFQNRDLLFAGWTSMGHPQVTEMLARSGVDFIGIDIEHSTISQEQSQRIIAACHADGVCCLPRVASHNSETIKRLLDSGADGVIVPTVETSEQVEKLIEWVKYPPTGKRGYGIARAQGYGHDFQEYTSQWNESSILIIQIESISAVENIEQLLKFDEVDGAMVGPYDISGSLGIPGQIDNEKVLNAGREVVEACRKFGKACGTQDTDPTPKSVQLAMDSGYTFVVLASDVFILWKWGEQMQKLIAEYR
ncbi:MAG: 4-hydroxy-2-oxovalerate aldolase [Candidatus Marinimicrobia bacterium]|jgi:2-keto-3-deoxy-L-rhamnonate aldolase RhmA|nr:4-hydroxy-2-oxovalerate aldolase [Candidatus Neomarinimicrobiota bacterium]MBT7270474.1 4-hydroxy-2-oxovalerate aldolase [Candidatus Neomarinimicrobiota bacterium]